MESIEEIPATKEPKLEDPAVRPVSELDSSTRFEMYADSVQAELRAQKTGPQEMSTPQTRESLKATIHNGFKRFAGDL